MQLYPYKQVSINQPPLNPFVNIFKALERAKKRDVAIRIWEVVQQEWPPSNLFKKNALYKFLDYRNVDYSSILSKKLLPISDWFKQKQYKDVLDYIVSVGCSYYFEYIPLSKFGLPVPEK